MAPTVCMALAQHSCSVHACCIAHGCSAALCPNCLQLSLSPTQCIAEGMHGCETFDDCCNGIICQKDNPTDKFGTCVTVRRPPAWAACQTILQGLGGGGLHVLSIVRTGRPLLDAVRCVEARACMRMYPVAPTAFCSLLVAVRGRQQVWLR